MSHQPGANGLGYDETLLDHAPQVSKSQRQEGYDADILNPAPAPTRTPPLAYNERSADVESGSSPREKHLAAGGYDPVDRSAKKPFWKTTKGLIIIAVIALIVIAAAVGGGVGGALGGKKNTSSNAGQPAGDGSASGTAPSSTSSTASGSTTPAPSPVSTAQDSRPTSCKNGDLACIASTSRASSSHTSTTPIGEASTTGDGTPPQIPTQVQASPPISSPTGL